MEENKTTTQDAGNGLKKVTMKPFQIAFMLFCLVAAGAFGIEDMLPVSGPGLTIVMLIVFAIIWAHPISKVVSELSALMPGEGGIYVWVKEAFGEFWGFAMSWWGTVSIYLGMASFVVLMTDYATELVPALENPTVCFLTRVAIVIVFVVINLIGIEEVSWVNTALSVLILIAFAGVTIVGFTHWNYNPMVPFTPEGQSIIDSLGGSICIVIWMYCGYECVSNIAGEIANPEVIPKGFRMVMPVIALSYILPTIAGIVSLGRWEEWGTDGLGFGDVLMEFAGRGWGVAFIAIAVVSQAAIFNSYIAAGSRGFFVMADDHLCPKFLVKVSKKSGLPWLAIVLIGCTTIIMCQFDFSTLLIILGPLALMVYVVLGFALLKIRKEFPVEERDCWYIPGSKAKVTVYAVLPAIIAVIGLLVNGTEYFLLGFVSIGSAVVAYVIFKLIYGGLAKNDPEKYPINPKTKLAEGDLPRIGFFILLFGLYALLGSLFLTWYEGEWGPDYYLEMYETGLTANFWLMIKVARIGGIIASVVGAIIYLASKNKDKSSWHGTGDWGEWASRK